jgi:flagellar biosynthesis chaperone FliJ
MEAQSQISKERNSLFVQMRPTLRCVMTAHRQADLMQDLQILYAAVQHHHHHIDAWVSIATAGTIQMNDPGVLVKNECSPVA